MPELEDLQPDLRVHGVVPGQAVTVIHAQPHGADAVVLTYREDGGRVGQEVLYRQDERRIWVDEDRDTWTFDADGKLFRLASEALRIRLAHLFDPYLAVHTSNLEPLPHQITAVYEEMLQRQPLRFVLADDPGAGKTIMAGLLIKELMIRGDLARCLIVAPGNLVEQWQDELSQKLGLRFEIVTREAIEAAVTGNPYLEKNLVISRLDHLSRNEDVQAKLGQTEWDLVVVDEAHKMSAHFYGNEVKKTKRYLLGELLGGLTRHLLLMTATPHSGKDEDFQLFMALIDPDRFEGRPRNGARSIDAQGLMRRLVKEKLLKFDGRPLFPERVASTVTYELSPDEQRLYDAVTDYVREEMNRADVLRDAGQKRRGAIVGFALTVLQRRLASSPEAIYQSIVRRRKRLEARLAEEEQRKHSLVTAVEESWSVDEDDLDEIDDRPDDEVEAIEDEVVDEATAAKTIAELGHEIETLKRLEELAYGVLGTHNDKKWDELSALLDDENVMLDAKRNRRKLIVFTEHRDTLNYLARRIRTRLGEEAVATIHGGLRREDRRRAQATFVHDPTVSILVATDAAGEGVNLQRAHLLVNYDLPWNPNRIEQRFGRIHRIGQTEVCHMWNLVAEGTREGAVFGRLFDKLKEQRKALGGQVFDVLGEVFEGAPLRNLLIEAIRYGDRPEVRARLDQVVDDKIGPNLKRALHDRALVSDVLAPGDIDEIREKMEEAEARRLQPHFIRAFFLEAFRLAGGQISRREEGRYEITQVPADIRHREQAIRASRPISRRYERVTFEKDYVGPPGEPHAELLAPGHPLLDATVHLVLERYQPLLKRCTVLVAEGEDREEPRSLVYLEDAIQSARIDTRGSREVISKRLQFVELPEEGDPTLAGYAPYLDYRPLAEGEQELIEPLLAAEWLASVESRALSYAIQTGLPAHLEEVRRRVVARVDKTIEAVQARLTREIVYWDNRAEELKKKELAGKKPKLNSGRARQRADELELRRRRRLAELEQEKQLAPLPPVVLGGALVVPAGLLERLRGERKIEPGVYARETARIDRIAVDSVLAAERALGREPTEMSHNNPGFDVLSRDPVTGEILFIEVKGRVLGAPIVTVKRNQILTALNKPDQFILGLVAVDGDRGDVRYLRQPFAGDRQAFFDVTSVNYEWDALWGRGRRPEEAAPTVAHLVGQAIARVVREFDPLRIVVFGSHSRRDTRDGSDVDLLVVLPRVEDKIGDAAAIRRALGDLRFAKDVIVASEAEVDESAGLRDSVIKTATTEGRVVYERV